MRSLDKKGDDTSALRNDGDSVAFRGVEIDETIDAPSSTPCVGCVSQHYRITTCQSNLLEFFIGKECDRTRIGREERTMSTVCTSNGLDFACRHIAQKK